MEKLREYLALHMGLVHCDFNPLDRATEIISKEFQFIDWLITNWKIDNIKLLDLCGKDDCVVPMHFEDDKQKIKALILILSISDDPINDLISVLKEWADK